MEDKVIKKFWDSVEKTNYCWNWAGLLDKGRWPIIRTDYYENAIRNYKIYFARRVSLSIIGKEITSKKVSTTCRNNLCVNPDHLCSDTHERFLSKIQKMPNENGGCWVWLGYLDSCGYGCFSNGSKGERAHRYSWTFYNGRNIPDNLYICHTCDHPYCVNPEHLFIGTQQENMDDRNAKGRQPKGTKIHSTKLDESQVKEIKNLISLGYSNKEIAPLFNVAKSSIWAIRTGRTWKYIM